MVEDASRVLVVDRHTGSRQLLVATLESCGLPAHAVQARSLAEAEELLEQHTFDLVLLDLHLPDGSGLEALRRLRGDARHAGTRAVVLTAGDSAAWEEAAPLAPDAYFVKPLNLEVLERLLLALGEAPAEPIPHVVRHDKDLRTPDPYVTAAPHAGRGRGG